MIKSYPAFLFLMLIASFSNCNSQQILPESSSVNSNSLNFTKAENQIVFLFFTIEKDNDGREIVLLQNKIISKGIVKEQFLESKENITGNILVTFLGKDGNEISTRILEDPLNPEMEIYAEEELKREKIHLQKAEFSIRFNQAGNIAKVFLEKINVNSKQKLLTIKL